MEIVNHLVREQVFTMLVAETAVTAGGIRGKLANKFVLECNLGGEDLKETKVTIGLVGIFNPEGVKDWKLSSRLEMTERRSSQ